MACRLTSDGRSASPVPASAVETLSTALKPEFDVDGLVIAYRNFPVATAFWICRQVTRLPPSQPRPCATERLTPRMTGESMMRLRACTDLPALESARYLSWANHAAS